MNHYVHPDIPLCSVWRMMGVTSDEAPHFQLVHHKVLIFRKEVILKGLTGLCVSMVQVTIQPQAKCASESKRDTSMRELEGGRGRREN